MPAKGSKATGGGASKQMHTSDASRIQSANAKAGNDAGKGTFPARAQAAAARNANAPGAGAGAGAKAGKGPKA
ncbi:uncharacterized protein LAESUDRAFT_815612 [Laetiporus sulphureus 93-53]|uniref:SMP domain-containing protein n=1 Tax=Laetiporus sulphureus 93-53 TaxID=1314785 RepID=A0A165C130_9APHY|nr:uncharacterized protein LAESUDRAFT_815612 [Laetiporus sulphureus 93-53]KZT02009.1 hypothetical protein LAESUDRAFT_815612 [Laetiporus sulphureus 93-53]